MGPPFKGENVHTYELAEFITAAIRDQVAGAGTVTEYREPLISFVAASDPRFPELRRVVEPTHKMPQDLLPGAQAVVSFFLPFAPWVVQANARDRAQVAREWSVAYVETNALIGRITDHLIGTLGEQGIRAAAEPATHNFDPVSLVSQWSHKSVAVIAGLGSYGLHHMIITDAGCAGRFGSMVLEAELPITPVEVRQRCLYFHDGSCLECVTRCPAGALDASRPIDKHVCDEHLHAAGQDYQDLGLVDVCGKCAVGPCSFESAVPY
jgi:epoxyqueuosine reductase